VVQILLYFLLALLAIGGGIDQYSLLVMGYIALVYREAKQLIQVLGR
jgi:hypothetical protein